jgi:hypothetical protein
MRTWTAALVTFVVITGFAACGGSSATAPTSSGSSPTSGAGFPAGTLVFKNAVIDQSAMLWITPLGNMNPPSHTLPTDHIYFYFANPNAGGSPLGARVPFYAPGDGTVTWMLGGAGQESKIMVRQTSTYSYYLDHLILAPGISVGTVLTAGQPVGTTGNAYAVDLGVVNDSLTQAFVNPSRYTDSEMLHADAPLKYYTEPLRSQLYARVQRLGADRDGVINYDKAGTLAGNWYSQFGNGPLSFAYDTYDPSRPMVAIGVGPYQAVFAIAPGQPAPSDVTVASGRVVYTLAVGRTGPNQPTGGAPYYMLVQMTDDTHIREEIFTSYPTDFTANALTFLR